MLNYNIAMAGETFIQFLLRVDRSEINEALKANIEALIKDIQEGKEIQFPEEQPEPDIEHHDYYDDPDFSHVKLYFASVYAIWDGNVSYFQDLLEKYDSYKVWRTIIDTGLIACFLQNERALDIVVNNEVFLAKPFLDELFDRICTLFEKGEVRTEELAEIFIFAVTQVKPKDYDVFALCVKISESILVPFSFIQSVLAACRSLYG